MHDSFLILGLQPEASLADIKRAYARLLKKTRPDDDPTAFQRLEEAYERCLALKRMHAGRVDGQSMGEWPVASATGRTSQCEVEDDTKSLEIDALNRTSGILPEAEPIRSRIVRIDPQLRVRTRNDGQNDSIPLARPEAALNALLEEVVVEAERQDAAQLGHWLHTHDAMVALDIQQLLSTRLPGYIMERKPKLDVEKLRVLYDYFLGTDYNANYSNPQIRLTFEHAKCEEQFQRDLASLRRRYSSTIDRMLFDELFGPAKKLRRSLLLSLPTMTERMGNLLTEVRRFDSQRAAQSINSEALALWSYLSAPGKLPLGLVALVHAQFAIGMGALVIGVVVLLGLDPHGMWGMALAGTIMASVVWFVLKSLGIANYHLAIRREKRRVSGTQSLDSISTVTYVLACVSLVFAVLQTLVTTTDTVLAFYSCSSSVLAAAILFLAGRSRRWEIALLVLSSAYAIWSLLTLTAGSVLSAAAAGAVSCAIAVLLVIGADAWHAKKLNVSQNVARQRFNSIALKFSGLSVVIGLITSYWL